MHRLLILSHQAEEYRRLIEAAGLPDLELIATTDPAEALSRGTACDLVFGEPSLIQAVLPQLSRLYWVQVTWAGVEPLLGGQSRRDYLLTNARGVFGGLMTEYVFGYLLLIERRMLSRYQAQQEGRWDQTDPGSLRGKRIGLLGVGSIGAHLARTAKHFGMAVSGYTRSSETCPDVDRYFHGAALPAFAADLDYLVDVLPGTPQTRRLVDASLLAALPQRAVFINIGRGSTLDEIALAEALRAGRIAGAVLDVFEQEPLPAEHIFWSMPNLLITAHTAALSIATDIAGLFIENYRRLMEGAPLKYRVDFERGY